MKNANFNQFSFKKEQILDLKYIYKTSTAFFPPQFVYLCISQNADLLVAKCSYYITMQ